MAIEPAFLERILHIGRRENVIPGGSVLILGDCDFLFDWAVRNAETDRRKFRELYGLSRLETIDVVGSPSIRFDLHQEAPSELRGQFDLIIDAGTIYNCFDVSSVFKNCFDLLKDTGLIIHHCALTGYFGRAYYNIHPALFKDLFEQNGFSITDMEVRVFKELSAFARWQRRWKNWRGIPTGQYKDIDERATFLKYADFVDMEFTETPASGAAMLPNDALLLCAARRRERQTFVKPIPSYYLKQ
jgi:SAM-dependent methyltransferase